MSCERYRGDLAALAVGALDPAAAQPLIDHIAACPECAGELAGMRSVAGFVARELRAWVETGPAPAGLEAVLRDAVRQAGPRPVDLEEVLALASPGARPVMAGRAGRRMTLAMALAAATVAGLLLVSTPAVRPGELPVVGSLVGLLRPQGGVPVRVDRSATAGGVTLTVHTVTHGPAATVVVYSLDGEGAGAGARPGLAALYAGGRALTLRRAEVTGEGGGPVRVVATYEAAPAGAPLVLRLGEGEHALEVEFPAAARR
ncbi:anti-sigma factor family protein [Caldinitratiruptor microaerophilus]|uniref:Zinc-finger domain-containing protein n=1 Tax=Caldinitratiruptor microaerophilus TaxID=671077 RepID=A0AA35G6S2_9FIRM|nr:hypothetical protein [Caldinitratiruptor microaerophilus]BDG61801.1 hypothetical protein caldi_28910 [Caldinitratiruptor microaerophilus]